MAHLASSSDGVVAVSLLSIPPMLIVVTMMPYLTRREVARLRATHRDATGWGVKEGGDTIDRDSPASSSSLSSMLAKASLRTLRCSAVLTLHQLYDVYPSGDTAYDLVSAVHCGVGVPSHPHLAFWQRGPGFRSVHHGAIEPQHRYFVFEPSWLAVTDGIMHTAELRTALLPIGMSDASLEASVAAWDTLRAQWALDAAANEEWVDEETRSCGSGEASTIPHTAAVLDCNDEERMMLFGHDVPSSSFPLLPPIREWDVKRCEQFLRAWQAMSEVAMMMSRDETRCFLPLKDGANLPLPFLLPWPRAGGEGDDRSSRALYVNRPRLVNDEPLTAAEFQAKRARADFPYDPFNANLPPDSFDVCHLSSVVRGCPWPLHSPTGQRDSRRRQEMVIVACRLAQMLHVNGEVAPVVSAMEESFHDGCRPVSATGDAASDCPYPLDEWFHSANINRFGRSSPSVLHALSSLLPASFLCSFGSEHLLPWPVLLVAPIANGWIGGVMGGGDTMG